MEYSTSFAPMCCLTMPIQGKCAQWSPKQSNDSVFDGPGHSREFLEISEACIKPRKVVKTMATAQRVTKRKSKQMRLPVFTHMGLEEDNESNGAEACIAPTVNDDNLKGFGEA